MKRVFSILFALALALSFNVMVTTPVAAADPPSTVASSTMVFKGDLTVAGGGVYTGIIPMVQESVAGGGDGVDGFDVYAKNGGCAYVQGYYGTGAWNCGGTDTYLIGADHDAYGTAGPWGSWYDPDCADWNQFALELTADHWYLRYSTWESPMSGVMHWYGDGTGYAAETDLGTQDRPQSIPDGAKAIFPSLPVAVHGGHGGSATHGGGAQAWDVDWGWGVEVIPLQYPGFYVTVAAGGSYVVILKPAAATGTATGTGTACFSTSAGVIENLTPVSEASLPPAALATKPINFPDGLFSFFITGLSNGQTVNVTITLPPGSAPTQYWKYHLPQGWSQIPMTIVGPPNVIRITLVEGGLGDDDGVQNGVIDDQGGGGSAVVGWETYPVSKVRVLLPWIALLAAIAAGVSLLVLRRRRAQS